MYCNNEHLHKIKFSWQLLEPHISQLCNYLSSPVTSTVVLQVFIDMSATNPVPFASHVTSLKHTVEQQPSTLPLASKVMGFVGAQCPVSISFILRLRIITYAEMTLDNRCAIIN